MRPPHMRQRNAVISTSRGLQIMRLRHFERHNMEVALAPYEFEPGDEAFIKYDANGRITFDRDARAAHHLPLIRKKAQHKIWNQSSPFQRFMKRLRRS